jgi:hypothetical protein
MRLSLNDVSRVSVDVDLGCDVDSITTPSAVTWVSDPRAASGEKQRKSFTLGNRGRSQKANQNGRLIGCIYQRYKGTTERVGSEFCSKEDMHGARP